MSFVACAAVVEDSCWQMKRSPIWEEPVAGIHWNSGRCLGRWSDERVVGYATSTIVEEPTDVLYCLDSPRCVGLRAAERMGWCSSIVAAAGGLSDGL